ncbi:bifunctional DNA primase/polymerase [Streptomyces sp. NBC_01408]|uniref:bifunctional DNA primase/polymerase n=1 Tax=Streptomyces sp. NBC_01408 TaxID=2903855 RepID=UPI00224F3CB4|nr:bifunctional DNA primase/polymerase [Streptomyces sp. NBC_01408]MCX4692118.1 bifunctional DNA primase/polymerase [Streptomyces sp. NBC_01408]
MREILGRRLQRLRYRLESRSPSWSWPRSRSRSGRTAPGQSRPPVPAPALLDAALTCATAWQWPVLPGVGRSGADSSRCACPDPDCAVPGAHPFEPGLLAATTDPRMVAWWWTNRPSAPVLMATGGAAPCAVSLPATAAARALVRLDAQGMRLGPVVATPTRWSLLVAPYSLERLGELLYAKDHVPSSLRFHGEGGYVLLPPSAASTGGQVRWEREPQAPERAQSRPGERAADAGRIWLPEVEAVVDALVEASSGAPGGGSRLAY